MDTEAPMQIISSLILQARLTRPAIICHHRDHHLLPCQLGTNTINTANSRNKGHDHFRSYLHDVYWSRTKLRLLASSQPSFHAIYCSSSADSCHTDHYVRIQLAVNIEMLSMVPAEYFSQPYIAKDPAFSQRLERTDPVMTSKPTAKLTRRKLVCDATVFVKLKSKDIRTVTFAPSDSPSDDVVSNLMQRDSSFLPYTQQGSVKTLSTNIDPVKEKQR